MADKKKAAKLAAWEAEKIASATYFFAHLTVGPSEAEKYRFEWPPESRRNGAASEQDRKIVCAVADLLEIAHSKFGRQAVVYAMAADGTALPIKRRNGVAS